MNVLCDGTDHYKLSAALKTRGVASALSLIQNLVRTAPEHLQRNLIEKVDAAVSRINDRAYVHVNAERRANDDFSAALDDKWRSVANPGTLHLELGAWTAWPEAVVASYIERHGIGDVVRLDMQPHFPIDVVASVTALPFRDNSIDRISSNSLFEHCAYPHEILSECLRVLRPGGVLFTAVPFHFVQHDCPSDYLRFTGAFFQDVCRDLGFSDVKTDTSSTSGVYYTLHTLAKSALVDEYINPDMAEFARLLHVTVMCLLVLTQGLDDEFVCGGASHWHTTKFFAVKGGLYTPSQSRFDRAQPFLKRHPNLFACPVTHLPLEPTLAGMKAPDGSVAYLIKNGVPEMFVLHGAGSMLARRPVSKTI